MASRSETETKLLQASAKNAELLRILAQTDHASPALAQQNRFVAELQANIDASEKRKVAADNKRKKELKDHEKFRDSVMRRFAYKATGKTAKFEAKAAKEETEYFEALQEEHREEEVNRNLRARLAEAQQVVSELEEEVRRHNKAQRELDTLYESIFKGTTPGFPEEDEKENSLTSATRDYQDCKSRAESEQHAVRLLMEAQYRMRSALGAVDEALSHSRMDMFGGGTFTDMMERNALHRAETETMGARMLVLQAQKFAPPGAIPELPPVEINHGNIMRDVFFDNVFTDMQFHEEIKASRWRVEQAARALDATVARAQERNKDLGDELRQRESGVQAMRAALQKAREEAFRSVIFS
ncbi:hypothetical protein B0H66DRAFT_486442 [Apodospora peruviana]|uniref:Uncharacterized protein n=1 Tax=Apodospora peruviana TaxID=516989 RepID=A0AAE0HSR3_9PEZI|nr:hypothetical protein B0H66DRAFT_486442 [Apodospora peruviana]